MTQSKLRIQLNKVCNLNSFISRHNSSHCLMPFLTMIPRSISEEPHFDPTVKPTVVWFSLSADTRGCWRTLQMCSDKNTIETVGGAGQVEACAGQAYVLGD